MVRHQSKNSGGNSRAGPHDRGAGKLSLELVCAIGGDRELSNKERAEYRKLHEDLGDALFTDLLFPLTGVQLPVSRAKALWGEIIRHKYLMSNTLGRPVGLPVATLDYIFDIEEDSSSAVSQLFDSVLIGSRIAKDIANQLDVTDFESGLDDEIRRYKRYKTPTTLLVLDIRFKNDADFMATPEALEAIDAQVNSLIVKVTRNLDSSTRFDPERFGVMLPQTGPDVAQTAGIRIRKCVLEAFSNADDLTVVVGGASCPRNARTRKTLMRRAEQALGQARVDAAEPVKIFS
jgi:GGDEF domain-containing protein